MKISNEKSWQTQVELADHYKAIGDTDRYLSRSESYPWEFVTDVKDGGMHRFVGSVSARLVAPHPCGLTFSWSLDYETPGASGASGYQLDRLALAHALRMLPTKAADQLAVRLAELAKNIHTKGVESQAFADSQFAQATSLQEFIRTRRSN